MCEATGRLSGRLVATRRLVGCDAWGWWVGGWSALRVCFSVPPVQSGIGLTIGLVFGLGFASAIRLACALAFGLCLGFCPGLGLSLGLCALADCSAFPCFCLGLSLEPVHVSRSVGVPVSDRFDIAGEGRDGG